MDIHSLTLVLYHTFLLPVVFLSLVFYIIALAEIFSREGMQKERKIKLKKNKLPMVTIQIPVYNDPIAVRCIEHCINFNYPKNKYEIQVVDDSDDKRTIELINEIVKKCRYKGDISIIRRSTRKGFKPGALNAAMGYAKGEIIVVFDSDFAPDRNFLRKLIDPLIHDEEIVAVQSKMGFLNATQNIITKYASSILMIYYNIVMHVSSKMGVTFLGGTGLAIRRKVLEELNGWNENSITEDADLSIKLMHKKYKIKFLKDLVNPGEVPNTLRGFLRQQMRWSYGMVRAFIENGEKIFSKNFSFRQRIPIGFITLGSYFSFFIIGMTFFGIMGWITGGHKQIQFEDIIRFLTTLLLTMGFAFSMLTALLKEKSLKNFPASFLAIFIIGITMVVALSVATIKATLNKNMWWHRTPKSFTYQQ